MKMKTFKIILTLGVVAFFVLHLNGRLMAKSINNKRNHKTYIKVMKENNKILHKNQNHFHKSAKNALMVRQLRKSKKFKLSSQMAGAKKECFNLHNIQHGTGKANSTNLIRGSMPWMVAIFKEINYIYKDTEYICGGSLISSWFVLAAAHCFLDGAGYWKVTKYSMLTVRLGMHDLSSYQYSVSEVITVYIHPNYKKSLPKMKVSDIALIKLKKIITYSSVIYPICIPYLTTPNSWDKLKMGKTVLISGWGQTASGYATSLHLQESPCSIENNKACKKFAKSYKPASTLCIGKPKNISKICYGDAGGIAIPLVAMPKNTSMVFPVAIGIVSFGDDKCAGPDILTKVESFKNWINYWTSRASEKIKLIDG